VTIAFMATKISEDMLEEDIKGRMAKNVIAAGIMVLLLGVSPHTLRQGPSLRFPVSDQIPAISACLNISRIICKGAVL
jgi:hypothetical protein